MILMRSFSITYFRLITLSYKTEIVLLNHKNTISKVSDMTNNEVTNQQVSTVFFAKSEVKQSKSGHLKKHIII